MYNAKFGCSKRKGVRNWETMKVSFWLEGLLEEYKSALFMVTKAHVKEICEKNWKELIIFQPNFGVPVILQNVLMCCGKGP